MALVIERWSRGKVVGGLNEWWDWIELALERDPSAAQAYPLLAAVDPYGDATLVGGQIAQLGSECRKFGASHPGRVQKLLDQLAELCDEALADPTGRLEFVGD